jgi:hypothetical protein
VILINSTPKHSNQFLQFRNFFSQNCMQWACSRVLLLDSIQWFISFFFRIFCYSLNNPKKSTSNYGEIVLQMNTLNANLNLIYKYKFHSQKKRPWDQNSCNFVSKCSRYCIKWITKNSEIFQIRTSNYYHLNTRFKKKKKFWVWISRFSPRLDRIFWQNW